jgi:hypothetical protein
MGAPFGNQNRSKDKLVEGALRRRLARNPEDADFIAEAMIERAKKGDIHAAVFVRDTVDGKPIKRIDVTTELDNALTLIGSEELRAAVRQRMAPFFREALSSVERSGEAGPQGHPRAN